MLRRAGSISSASMVARTWAAKASLNSIAAKSDMALPVLTQSFCAADMAARLGISGATPAEAAPQKTRPGGDPRRRQTVSETSTAIAAPSLIWQLFPAVTVPFTPMSGGIRASNSADSDGRGPSSCFSSAPAPSGTISASRPASLARMARRWLSSAKRSWLSREMP